MLERECIVQWLQSCAEVLSQNSERLTDLDSAIGDADHGINMVRGFQKVASILPGDGDIGSLFKTVAMTLISSVGGASGPLYGTIFLRASTVLAGRAALSADDVGLLLHAAVEGVMQRGRAAVGDKTMLDTLAAADDAYHAARAGGADLEGSLHAAVEAGERGMTGTVPMIARKGRASYLGERSVGHQDPGATSAWLILRELEACATASAGKSRPASPPT